jgi:alginate O-acetyltransferase complex protein AlgI
VRIYFTWFLIPVVLVALPVFWLVLRRAQHRLIFALAVSVGGLAILNPIFTVIAIGLVAVTWQVVALHQAQRLKGGRAVLLMVTIALLTLLIGKYGERGAMAVWGSDDPIVTYVIMPLGVSYFVLRLLQYAFDRLRGVIHENSLLRLAAFVMWIPAFPAGPLETYQGFYEKQSPGFDRQLFYEGLRRIAVGYFKKVFVADFLIVTFLGTITRTVGKAGFDAEGTTWWWPLAYVIIVFVRAYFDLSAYTDLAIGFSRLFGFRIMENFHYPFWKANLGEFWRGWHISLASWCRNNVYFPVFGLTRKPWLGLYLSMLTMGLWHYLSWNWALWGLWHGTGLVVVAWWERRKKTRKKRRKKAGKRPVARYEPWVRWLGYPTTFMFVALGYAFVGTRTPQHAFKILALCVLGPLEWLTGMIT